MADVEDVVRRVNRTYAGCDAEVIADVLRQEIDRDPGRALADEAIWRLAEDIEAGRFGPPS
jgi:hypothetical protein